MKSRKDQFVPNPILGSLFGIFPLAAAASSLVNGTVLGLGAAFSSLALAGLLPGLRAVAPERLLAPLSLGIAAALALLFSDLTAALAPGVASGLGVYLPLLAVNCLSLHVLRGGPPQVGRTESSPAKIGTVFKEALGYFLVALLVGAVREAAGFGSLVLPAAFGGGIRVLLTADAPMRLLASPAGGFILIGCAVALYRAILRGAGRRIP